MKNNHDKIDKALKDVVSKFEKEPPGRVWKGISKRMFFSELKSFNLLNYQARLYMVIFLTFCLIGTVVYFTIFNNTSDSFNNKMEDLIAETNIGENKPITSNAQNDFETSVPVLKSLANNKSSNKKNYNKLNKSENNQQATNVSHKKEKREVLSKGINIKAVTQNPIVNDSKETVDKGGFQLTPENQKLKEVEFESILTPINNHNLISLIANINKLDDATLESGFDEPLFHNIKFDDYKKSRQFFLDVSYTPEKMYNVSNSYVQKRINTFEMNAGFNYSDYFVQTGAGLSFVQDVGEYQIDYSKFDVVGSYSNLDSIGANVYIDTILNQTVINLIYYSHNEDIYDSIKDILTQHTNNSYTYLNIPLLLGYKKEYKRWSVFLKGGPVLSFLIYRKEPGVTIIDDKMVISSVTNKTPARLETNWQFLFSLGCAYRLTNKLYFAVEPTWKFYRSNYSDRPKSSSGQPNSFGIKTGLIWNY